MASAGAIGWTLAGRSLLTRSSERERSGLSRWETEGGALAPDVRAAESGLRRAGAATAARGTTLRNAKNRTSPWHGTGKHGKLNGS